MKTFVFFYELQVCLFTEFFKFFLLGFYPKVKIVTSHWILYWSNKFACQQGLKLKIFPFYLNNNYFLFIWPNVHRLSLLDGYALSLNWMWHRIHIYEFIAFFMKCWSIKQSYSVKRKKRRKIHSFSNFAKILFSPLCCSEVNWLDVYIFLYVLTFEEKKILMQTVYIFLE